MEHQKPVFLVDGCFTNLLEDFEMYDMGDLLDRCSSPKDLKSKLQNLGDKIEYTFKNSLLIKRQQTIFQMKTGFLKLILKMG